MAEGKPAFKRTLAVDIEKPTHQEAAEVEDFPSPPPLYTPTTREVEETLDKEMADKKPAFTKSLSLSIDRPTDKAAEENEPPPVDPLPTPSQKEIENLFEEDMKQAKSSSSEKDKADSGAHHAQEETLSKSQKKKAKKKAKQAEQADVPVPTAYLPGSQWEPDEGDDDDDDLAPSKPAQAVPATNQTTATPAVVSQACKPDVCDQSPMPTAYVPGSQWEPDGDEDSLDSLADKAAGSPGAVDSKADTTMKSTPPLQALPTAPATPASTDGSTTQAGKSKAVASPAVPHKTGLKPDNFFLKDDGHDSSNPVSTMKPVPSKLSNEMISKFATAEPPPQSATLARTPSGSTRKWAPVPAPVLRKSLIDMGSDAEEKPAVAAAGDDSDVPEPAGPVEYKKLLAGNPASWPKGIRADRREKYLSDTEFEHIFGMGKADFAKLKQWKKTDLKKAVKLF